MAVIGPGPTGPYERAPDGYPFPPPLNWPPQPEGGPDQGGYPNIAPDGYPFPTPRSDFDTGMTDTSGGTDLIGQRLANVLRMMPQGGNPGGNPEVPMWNEDFASRIQALLAHVKGQGSNLGVFSGPRSPEMQKSMFDNAVGRYGDPSVAKNFIAQPGESLHEVGAGLKYGLGRGGLAADLQGDLRSAYDFAPKYGLEFGSKNSPWHVQMAGLRG